MRRGSGNIGFIIFVMLVMLLVAMALMTGKCSRMMARSWGGSQTVDLPAGKKLVNVAWKGDCLWYVLRDFKDGETPTTITLKEDASWGMLNGTVTIIEHRQ